VGETDAGAGTTGTVDSAADLAAPARHRTDAASAVVIRNRCGKSFRMEL
jgi:hypothetical protein